MPTILLAGTLSTSLLWRQLWTCSVPREAESGGMRGFRALFWDSLAWGALTAALTVAIVYLAVLFESAWRMPIQSVLVLLFLGPVLAVVLVLMIVIDPQLLNLPDWTGWTGCMVAALIIPLACGLAMAAGVSWLWRYYPLHRPSEPEPPAAPTGLPKGGKDARQLRVAG
ncbi:MAG: hypothetical protein FJX77_09135 [Armatimonadetes bacterium]|nr:hypothetical protein [Armatimonadota bacterium]